MKVTVFSISHTATVRDAIHLLVDHHIGLLPVVDENRKPVGVVGLRDLLILALPSVFSLMDDVDFVGDFGAVELYLPSEEVLSQPISALMRPGTVVDENSGLLRAYALMLQHDLHDLPVVDSEGRLTGIASRVDLGTKVLSTWLKG